MTNRSYLQETSLSGSAEVTNIATDEHGAFLVLSNTYFHVQGGGQPSDRGSINEFKVLKVVAVDGHVRHYMESVRDLLIGQRVLLKVEDGWRNLCSRLHTAGHLISALVEIRNSGAQAVGGHHWPGESRVEFSGLSGSDLERLKEGLNYDLDNAIKDAYAVNVLFDQEGNRTIKIGSLPAISCGGTHVESTEELHGAKVLHVKRKADRVRVSYEVAPNSTQDTQFILTDEIKYIFSDGTANYLNWSNYDATDRKER
jgi:alanyl-tRNA synthetase